jgi:hypothetical protein
LSDASAASVMDALREFEEIEQWALKNIDERNSLPRNQIKMLEELPWWTWDREEMTEFLCRRLQDLLNGTIKAAESPAEHSAVTPGDRLDDADRFTCHAALC